MLKGQNCYYIDDSKLIEKIEQCVPYNKDDTKDGYYCKSVCTPSTYSLWEHGVRDMEIYAHYKNENYFCLESLIDIIKIISQKGMKI